MEDLVVKSNLSSRPPPFKTIPPGGPDSVFFSHQCGPIASRVGSVPVFLNEPRHVISNNFTF